MDAYPHVRNRFRSINQLRLITWEGTHQTLALRREAYTRFSDYTRTKLPNASIEVCGEPGFECTGCISLKDCKILGYTPSREDKCQQRNACACLALKYELLKNRSQCTHACAYCYWH